MIQPTPGYTPAQLQRQLDSLIADFTHWRTQRSHHRAAVPQPLRDRGVSLALASSRVRVSKGLGVSYAILNAWSPTLQATTRRRGTSHPSTPACVAAPAFVPLEHAVVAAALPAFTVSTSSGLQLTIEGACSAAQISALVLALCATAAA